MMSRGCRRPGARPRRWIAIGVALLAGAVVVDVVPTRAPAATESRVEVDAGVRAAAHAGRRVRVLVELRPRAGQHLPEGTLGTAVAVGVQRADIGEAQREARRRLGKAQRVHRTYDTIPYLAVEVGPEGLAQLEAAPLHVRRVIADEVYERTLAESGPLVQAPIAWAHRWDGAGTVIAILDTGISATHPFLAGKVVEEACYSGAGSAETSLCPSGAAVQVGPGAGAPCAPAGCEHGTHVAGIAAGAGVGAGQPFSGVAKGAGIVSIQIYSRTASGSMVAFTSDVLAALERVYLLRHQHRIASVNMSFGNSARNTTFCDTHPLKPMIDNLRSVGIAAVVASGNNGYLNGVSSPACISSAISVAATTKTDQVSSFSNVAPFLSLFAPGSGILSSLPAAGFGPLSGTSMAAPHVSGAFAVLRQARPTASVTQLLGALQSTGSAVVDTITTRPGIRVAQALASLGAARDGGAVDFSGDGLADLVIHDRERGDWFVGLSTGSAFVPGRWATRFGDRGDGEERALVGDFTGDGLTDVAIHDHRRGRWFVGRAGAGTFAVEAWADGFGDRGPEREGVFVGDFDGDGRADVALHDRQTGDWFVGRSTGAGFAVSRWATGFGNRGPELEDVFVADFTGDGRADVAVHDRPTGQWWIGRSTGSGLVVERWATNFGTRGRDVETIFVADFTGDGRADVAVHDRQTGDWHVGVSTGTGFHVAPWARSFGNRGAHEQVHAGDFTGDGRADVALHDRRTGDWWVGVSTGSAFTVQAWATRFGNRGESERTFVGDFTGDGRDDVAIHDRQTGAWYVGRSNGAAFVVEWWAARLGDRGEAIEREFAGRLTIGP
jgi:subtilisin family serine protease